MINYVYQLVGPRVFSVKYMDIGLSEKVIIRPKCLALCHADQRYYQGRRTPQVLKKKLPMALIHECCGKIVYDPTGTFKVGELVVPIPNIPGEASKEIYENYACNSGFMSSGEDGFLREYIEMPADRIVSIEGISSHLAAITEFISVAVHAAFRFELVAHENRKRIGIWGDGSLAYCVSMVLKSLYPEASVIVIGHSSRKLSYFSFVEETYLSEEIPNDFSIDHSFECCGGEGSSNAIDDIIKYIKPQGTMMMMGVSENKIAINTRDILEKGITAVGCSRSGIKDFQTAVELMKNEVFQKRLESIVYQESKVKSIDDIHRVFQNDINNPFKTVFEFEV